MSDADLCFLSIADAATEIERGELSPVELTEAFLRRIETLDPHLHSYITVTGESALAQAERAAAAIAQGRPGSACRGIPVNHKDLIDTAGIRTTSASRLHRDRVPDEDAHVVARLSAAGAVTLGKSTLNEFAFGWPAEDDLVPAARNPWNPDLPTGLSSSGSAVSVAAGLAMASIGTDSGGSIRIPASYCGVTGLKPTFGLIGRTGVVPLSPSADHVGILARSALDAALVLEAAAGHDPHDPGSSRRRAVAYGSRLRDDVRGMRIGVPREYLERVGADDEVLTAFETALGELGALGAVIRDVSIPSLEYAPAATFTILFVEGFRTHFPDLRDRASEYGAAAFQMLAAGGLLTDDDLLRALRARTLISAELAHVQSDLDALATPATPATARGGAPSALPGTDPHVAGQEIAYVAPFDLTGSPAVSVCSGFTADGLPIGLQLVGRAFDEITVLGIAHRYQSVTDHHLRRPPV